VAKTAEEEFALLAAAELDLQDDDDEDQTPAVQLA
jgi:hypothetical protein